MAKFYNTTLGEGIRNRSISSLNYTGFFTILRISRSFIKWTIFNPLKQTKEEFQSTTSWIDGSAEKRGCLPYQQNPSLIEENPELKQGRVQKIS